MEGFLSIFKGKPQAKISNHIFVGSTLFRVPVESDGSVLLSEVQRLMPKCSGLWFYHEDHINKTMLKFDDATNKLFPPFGGWGRRVYHICYDSMVNGFEEYLAFEQFEISMQLFQQAAASVKKFFENDNNNFDCATLAMQNGNENENEYTALGLDDLTEIISVKSEPVENRFRICYSFEEKDS